MDELRKRVTEATGPDRELDVEVCAACGYMPDCDPSHYIAPVTFRVSDDASRIEALVNGDVMMRRLAHKVTASIDEALALVEKTLPETTGYTIIAFENGNGVQVSIGDEIETATTAPIAILSALLSALAERARGEPL